MMHRVRRLNVAQMAKVMGVLYLLIGVVIAVCIVAVYSIMPKGGMASTMFPMAGGMVMVIGMPLLYAAFGYLIGALMAWLYNVVVGWVGGIELDLEPLAPG